MSILAHKSLLVDTIFCLEFSDLLRVGSSTSSLLSVRRGSTWDSASSDRCLLCLRVEDVSTMCHDNASYTCIMFNIVLYGMNVYFPLHMFFDPLIVYTVSSIIVCFGMFICYILCTLQKEEIKNIDLSVLLITQNISNIALGDRVAIEPIIPCRHCDVCRSGQYNLCTHRKHNAQPPTQGNLSRFYVHDVGFCYK